MPVFKEEAGGWVRTAEEREQALREGWKACWECGAVFWFPAGQLCVQCRPLREHCECERPECKVHENGGPQWCLGRAHKRVRRGGKVLHVCWNCVGLEGDQVLCEEGWE